MSPDTDARLQKRVREGEVPLTDNCLCEGKSMCTALYAEMGIPGLGKSIRRSGRVSVGSTCTRMRGRVLVGPSNASRRVIT
jgi:hypothetical protein